MSFLKEYKKKFKDHPIYVFSSLDSDETLDQISDLKRIIIDKTLATDPIAVDSLKNSVCVFDDVDVIGDKETRAAVYTLLNQCLEVGRHHNIYLLITNHLATNGKDTRRILNEAHTITYFPHSGSSHGARYLLEKYCGLDKKEIMKQKKMKSRSQRKKMSLFLAPPKIREYFGARFSVLLEYFTQNKGVFYSK